jgi:nucleotide-binding universal stress UspA family protein
MEVSVYSKVVVPLDGSKLAEAVLPHLEEIVKAFKIKEVMLVSVTEKVKGRLPQKEAYEEFVFEHERLESPARVTPMQVTMSGPKSHSQQDVPLSMGKMAKSAVDYLDKIAAGLDKLKTDVTITIMAGNPAEEIVRFAEEQGADLILMASRGKTGFSRWDMGNIAEKVIKATRATVVLVKPEPGFKETKPKRRGVAV